ncbi:PHP domain-containing protein [Enterocloster citroniae]|uniref:PHP domain-containing protein n=1 Tax=Enterocloster citroniae TaxID=358743 RepID=UPI0003142A6D|nr:PHP domain-containing protein [Enterocloster citroniae]MCC3383224.1 PHP domain-containing protein [Enterocloster citroniae]
MIGLNRHKLIENVLPRLKFEFPYNPDEWLEKKMVMENYHKHTTWSNLVQIDSATSVEEFMDYLNSYGCRCFFSGEHGYQGEWLYIYDKCRATQNEKWREAHGYNAPLKFCYSTEAYWVKDRFAKDRSNCHIVIVARNYNAMRKLNYILSEANVSGFYGKPRIDLNLLFSLDYDDVYVTSACIAGWKYDDAEDIWLKIWKHFRNHFFLEYQANNTPAQKELNSKIYELSKRYGIQTIIGLDTHYLNEEDHIKRENLLQRKGIRYPEESGWHMDFPNGDEVFRRMMQQNVLPPDEIVYAMMNTHVFVSGVDDIEIDTSFKIPILPQYQKYSYDERVKILRQLLYGQYEKEENQSPERLEGLKYEISQIVESGTADYFLDDYHIIKLATSVDYGGQLTTTSRGSASSYYTSKLLGFTTMDRFESEVPIYPERFITKERIQSSHQMPDVDLNCAAQEPFVGASKSLLGEEGCYPLLAVGKFGEKSGFKLYADIKGISPSIANEITACIELYNNALKDADDEEDKKRIFIEDYITDPKLLKVFNDSKPYQGIIEQAKVHACGHLIFNGNPNQKNVIGYGDIRYEIGLIRCCSESTGRSVLVACVEGNMLDAYGYVKNDYLIVDVVGIIYKLYHSIGMEVPTVNQLRRMVQNDSATWNMYARGITCCLNQCEKESTTRKVMRYRPRHIKELAAFIAGIRPGFKSLINGFLDRIEYSNGESAIDELLEDSFHYMLYQEAVMRIFAYLGIEMKESYDTIKGISKKKLKGKELEKIENSLKEHWLRNIGNLNNFIPVYKVIKDSARYSFNAPHALAMAFDSLYEAWFKAHYTSKFYEVTLNHYQGKNDKDKIAALQKEAMNFFDYKMGEFAYGKDNSQFVVDDEERIIYPNLASIKGIGVNVVKDMMSISNSGLDDFVEIRRAIKGTQINATVFKNLVKIGYFKKYGSIKKLLNILEIYNRWAGSSGDGLSTIPKASIPELGLENIDIQKFASDITPKGNISKKQYTNLNWIGLVKELAQYVPDDEYGVGILLKFQLEVLDYIDYVNPEFDPRYCMVLDIDTKYSPKILGYCLSTGQKKEFKIHKKRDCRKKEIVVGFDQCPIDKGDIIYIKSFKKELAVKKVDDEWIEIPGVFNTWINDYSKIQLEQVC